MPNFIAKNIKNKPYPFCKDDVSFLWEVQNDKEKLIYTKSENESFFIVQKQNEKSNFIIKGEKLTKPAKIGLLQKALCIYKDENTSDVLSLAIALKDTRLLKSEFILNINEFKEKFKILQNKFSKIFIEIGFGSGRHAIYQAKNNQDTLVIGIEVYKPSIEQVAKLARSENLENLYLINSDARLILSLLNSNLIDKIFLHFPVPWDKAPHRRVVSLPFALECQRTLKPNSHFELRTDSKEYANFSINIFLELENSRIELKKNENLEISSKYEDRWKRQNKDIFDMRYTCLNLSKEREKIAEFSFLNAYDLDKISKNFKNLTIKEEDFFVHFEEIYTSQKRAVIKLAFGAFSRPEHCFLKIEDEKCEYFIKKPLPTKENQKAHIKIEEFLIKCNQA